MILEKLSTISSALKSTNDAFNEIYQKQQKLLAEIPNIAASDVPEGKDESQNVEIKRVGDTNSNNVDLLDHVAIGELLGLYLSEEATNIAQSRFIVQR